MDGFWDSGEVTFSRRERLDTSSSPSSPNPQGRRLSHPSQCNYWSGQGCSCSTQVTNYGFSCVLTHGTSSDAVPVGGVTHPTGC